MLSAPVDKFPCLHLCLDPLQPLFMQRNLLLLAIKSSPSRTETLGFPHSDQKSETQTVHQGENTHWKIWQSWQARKAWSPEDCASASSAHRWAQTAKSWATASEHQHFATYHGQTALSNSRWFISFLHFGFLLFNANLDHPGFGGSRAMMSARRQVPVWDKLVEWSQWLHYISPSDQSDTYLRQLRSNQTTIRGVPGLNLCPTLDVLGVPNTEHTVQTVSSNFQERDKEQNIAKPFASKVQTGI